MRKNLGFSCGEVCADCGDQVSLDGQGRYLCFSCGHIVQPASGTTPKPLKLRAIKHKDASGLQTEAAILKELGVTLDD